MSLDHFLHNLQCDPDAVKPKDWEVDWEDAPLPYKLYRGLPTLPLCPEIPLMLEGRLRAGEPELREIGHLLWYVYGLAQLCQSAVPPDLDEQKLGVMQSYRRLVPSGGALYPSELYVYLKINDAAPGVYHYDAAHHRLTLLREGVFDAYMTRALGYRCDLSDCFGVVLVSTVFWKNFYKYHNFAYRLQGLDAGVVIGQLLEAAKRFGFATAVCFQFLDRAVGRLLGLNEQEESVYAVIPLSVKSADTWFANGNEQSGACSAAELSRELTVLRHEQYVRSRNIRPYPMLIEMNEACFMESTESFRQLEGEQESGGASEAVALPQVTPTAYDLAAVSRKRYSPGIDFVLSRVSRLQLAGLLYEATASFPYRNDLDGLQPKHKRRVTVYGCLYGVEDIPNGAYRYNSSSHELQPLRPGDHRQWLQQGMSLDNVNLFQVPICLHVAGDKDYMRKELGYRGYRIQQMEAGMLVQRLLLAALSVGFGGHPLLGFDVPASDDMYRMEHTGKTSLIQIPFGPYRARASLEGGLHC